MLNKKSHKFATLKDVARLAETSTATCSYVLSDATGRYVSDKLRAKVKSAAKTLGYVKSGAASSLKGKKTGVIAVLIPQYENHFFAGIFAAVERTAQKRGYVLATLNTFDDPEREKQAINQMVRLRVDGFLVIPTMRGGVNTETLRTHKVPCVSVERPLVGVAEGEYDFISSNNLMAGYLLTKNALENGHKRIALAHWQSEITSSIANLDERRIGYIQAMEEQGLFEPNLLFGGDITREEGARITAQILKDKTVTAIVYAHYILAEGGIQYLRKNGIRIPEDVSISLLGEPYWSDMVETDFTRIVQPSEELGRKAVEVLLARIEGDSGASVVLEIPTILHKGTSVGKLKR